VNWGFFSAALPSASLAEVLALAASLAGMTGWAR